MIPYKHVVITYQQTCYHGDGGFVVKGLGSGSIPLYLLHALRCGDGIRCLQFPSQETWNSKFQMNSKYVCLLVCTKLLIMANAFNLFMMPPQRQCQCSLDPKLQHFRNTSRLGQVDNQQVLIKLPCCKPSACDMMVLDVKYHTSEVLTYYQSSVSVCETESVY